MAGELKPTLVAEYFRLADAVSAAPASTEPFEELRKFLLGLGRYGLLVKWLEFRVPAVDAVTAAQGFVAVANALVAHPLQHALAIHCCERAKALTSALTALVSGSDTVPGAREAGQLLQFLQNLPSMVPQAQRELRAAAVEERDRRRAAQIYLQSAELSAVYDPNGADRLRENLDRCFLLWAGMPAALDAVEILGAEQLGMNWTLEVFLAHARKATDRNAIAGLWLRVARAAVRVGGAASDTLQEHLEQVRKADPASLEAMIWVTERALDAGDFAAAERFVAVAVARPALDPNTKSALLLLLAEIRRRAGSAEGSHAALVEALRLPNAPLAEIARKAEQVGDAALAAEAQRAELAAAASENDQRELPPAERMAQLERLAALQIGELGQPREGFETLARALALDPTQQQIWDALEALATAQGLGVQLTALYREIVGAPGAVSKPPAELARRLARQSGPDAAVSQMAWRRVLELAPGDAEAAAALREQIAHGGSDAEREMALRTELSAIPVSDQVSRLRLLHQILDLSRDPVQRAELLSEMVGLDPVSTGARRGLLREQLTLGRWEAAEQSARALLDAPRLDAPIEPPERLSLLRSLAAVLGKQGRLNEALPELEVVLREVPGDDQARRLLETLVERHPETLRAVQLLAEAELARGESARAAALFLAQADLHKDRLLATAALRRAAELFEEVLVDRRSALLALTRALQLDPSLAETRGDLVRVARELNVPGDAAAVLLEIAERRDLPAGDAAEIAIASAELALQLAIEARNPTIEARSNALLFALRPSDVRGAAVAADRAVQLGNAQEAVQLLLAQAAEAAETTERGGLLLRAAQVQATELKDPVAAIETYRQALKAGAVAGEVLPALAEALLQAGRVKEAIDTLGREAGFWAVRADPGRAVRIGLRRARLAREQLDDPPLAVDIYRDVLSRRPSEPEALAGLEELLSEPSARRAAGLVLSQAHERNHDLPKLVEVLELVADTEVDLAQRSQVLRRIATLCRGELRQPAQAFTALARASRLLPRDESIRGEIRDLAREDATLEAELVDLFGELSGHLPRESAARLLQEMGELAELKLQDLERAKALYQQSLAATPQAVGPLSGLYRIARSQGDAAGLVEIGEPLAALLSDADQRTQVLREVAQAVEGLGDGFKAIELWHGLLQDLPDDAQAAGELERLSEAYGVVTEKAEALAKKLRQAGDVQTPEGRKLAVRLAQVRRAQADVTGALQLLGQVLALDPAQADALALLEDWTLRGEGLSAALAEQAFGLLDQALTASGNAARRAQMLEGRLDRLPEAERAQASLTLLDVLERDLRQPQRAFVLASRAFTQFPDHPALAERLERLGEVTDSWDEISALYEDIATRAVPAVARALREKLARQAEARHQTAEAARHWLELLLQLPDDAVATQALDALEGGTAPELQSLAGVYATALGRLSPGSPLQLPLLARVAQLFEGPLQNPEVAAQVYERWVDAAPTSPEPLQSLVRIWRGVDNPSQLSQALSRMARLDTTEPSARRELWLEIAGLRERLSDQEGEMAAYREILAVDPRDPQALARLAALLGSAQRWDELAVLLSERCEQAAAEGDRATAAQLRLQLAEIHEQLGEFSKAIVDYRVTLQDLAPDARVTGGLERLLQRAERPEDKAAAAEILEPLYETTKNHQGLVAILQARAEAAPAGPVRAELLRRLAGLYLGELSAPEMAFVAASQSLREDPEAAGAVELAIQAGERAQVAEELSQLLEELVPRVQATRPFLALHWALAQLYEGPLQSPARAMQEWRKVVERNPDDQDAVEQLSALYLANDDVGSLLELLRRQLSVSEDVGTRGRLLQRIGELQADRQGDIPQAYATFRRLVELVPEDRQAFARLDDLAVRQQRWPELAGIIESEIVLAKSQGDTVAQVGLLERLAELGEGPLRDADAAVRAYGEMLELMPDHPGAIGRLEGLLSRDPQNLGAAELLERAHKGSQNWAKVAETLEARASAIADPQARRDIWLELARVREQNLGRPDLAFLALTRGFKDDPSDVALTSELERVAGLGDANEELVGILEEELERRPDLTPVLALRLGLVYDARLHDPARALQFLERAHELDPSQMGAGLAVLERLYRESENWQSLSGTLEEMVAQAADSQERVALLFRIGQLAEERLESPDRAAAAYEALRQIDATHLPALRSLERLYETAGRGAELLDILEQQRQLAPEGQARDRLTARVAEVAGTQLGDDARAIELWTELLRRNPKADNALSGLEKSLERTEKWTELVELLRRRLKTTVDPREINRLNDKLGVILGTRLGKADDAIASFKAVLERDPRNLRALEALREIHAARDEREELAAILRRLIPLQEDAAGVKRVRFQLSRVLAALGRREEAVEAGRRALDLEPHSLEELEDAEQLFRGLEAFPEVARTLETRAALYPPERREEAIAAYFGVAELFEGVLRKPEGGAVALEKVFELDPGNPRAFEALKRIYQKTQDFRRYAGLLDKLADQPGTDDQDPAMRARLLRELASIQEKRLGQKDLAFLALCRALQRAPLDLEVAAEARRLARETGSVESLAEVYLNVLDQIGPDPAAESLLLRLAEIQDVDLDDAQTAEDSLRRLLVLQPGNAGALDGLAQLFLRRGRSREYVVALEQKAEQIGDLEEKKRVLASLAKAYDEVLDEPDEAVATLRRGLDLDPADPALTEQLARLYRREKAFPDLVSLLQRAREMVTEPAERSRIQLQIAEITELELHEDEAALSAYHLALELDPKSLPALQALERLYSRLDRAAELLRIYERQLEVIPMGERAKVLFKAAQIWEEKLDNPRNALASLEGVLELEPRNTRALQDLARLYREVKDPVRLAQTLQRHISAVREISQGYQELVALQVALGGVLHSQLNRSDEAEQIYLKALEVDTSSQPALRALGELYQERQRWPQALEMIRREARLAVSSAAAVELHTRTGRILEEQLGNPAEAEAAYQRALEIDPTALTPLRALGRIYRAREDWESYLDVARQEAAVLPEGTEKAERLHDLGRFYQETREDIVNAERFYREALAVAPDQIASASPLADIYMARGDWPNAEAMLRVVVERLSAAEETDARELCRQYYRLGYVAEKLDHSDEALAAYNRAYDLDATYLPALEGLGNLLVRRKQFEEALKIFQAILIHHRDELTDLEVVEIHWQLAETHRALRQNDRALKSYEKALEIDPAHEPAHQALAELLESAGDFEGALEHRQKLLDTLEGEARFEASVQLARLSRDRLDDPYQAIDAYLQALKLRPDSLAVLEDVLALYRATKQSHKAVETLSRMLEQPEIQGDAGARRDLHFQLGTLLRDDLKDDARALESFDQALEADSTYIAAFAAIEGLLTERQDWPALEQAYHAMLRRLPKTPETHQARMALWRTLGELYHKVLKNPESAVLAYDVVAKAEPDNGQVAELLGELYAQMPGKEQQAILAQREALKHSADPVKVVKTLVRLHAALKEYDKAFVAAQVVVHLLGEHSPDEEQIIARLKRYTKEQASRGLTDRSWIDGIYHERLRGPMGEILALCGAATGGAFAVDHAKLNINRKRDKVDVASSMLFFANMYKYVAKVFGADALELYKVAGLTGLALGNTSPICMLAGEDMFKDRPKRELWFQIAKTMAFLRPELAMVRLHPADEVEAIVQAAVSLAVPDFAITADAELVAQQQRRLAGSLSEQARPALFRAAKEAVAQPGSLDLRPYLEAAEHTANRAGVLLCGDVEVAMRCLAQDQGAATRLPIRSKVRDLMLFCVSEPYSKLRAALGVAVEVKAEGQGRVGA